MHEFDALFDRLHGPSGGRRNARCVADVSATMPVLARARQRDDASHGRNSEAPWLSCMYQQRCQFWLVRDKETTRAMAEAPKHPGCLACPEVGGSPSESPVPVSQAGGNSAGGAAPRWRQSVPRRPRPSVGCIQPSSGHRWGAAPSMQHLFALWLQATSTSRRTQSASSSRLGPTAPGCCRRSRKSTCCPARARGRRPAGGRGAGCGHSRANTSSNEAWTSREHRPKLISPEVRAALGAAENQRSAAGDLLIVGCGPCGLAIASVMAAQSVSTGRSQLAL